MPEDLAFSTLAELRDGFASGAVSPREAMAAVYDRIDAQGGALNPFCHLLERGRALDAAAASEARWARGAPSGPLDGAALTVKDAILARGWATLRGSKLSDPDTPDAEDAPSVARLRAAGAIVIGKTTTPEFGWKAVTDSPLTGVTRNPWNPALTPGGSSGGGAAAVAAGMGAAAVGTDAGGSVRIPGAFCGLVALKPSAGRVANYPPSSAGPLGHVGPMTRTVADAALMLNAMAGSDPRDPSGLPEDGADWLDGLEGGARGLRVAWSPTLGYARVDPEVAEAAARAAASLEALGARVETVEAPFDDPTDCFRTLFHAGAAHALRGVPEAKFPLLDPGLARVVERGRALGLGRYMEALDTRAALSRTLKAFFGGFDLLATPTVAVPPFEAGRLSPDGYDPEDWLGWSPFTYPFNLTGQPALTVPCGVTGAGLPVGLQLAAQYHGEAVLLRAARAFEAANPPATPASLARRRPPS